MHNEGIIIETQNEADAAFAEIMAIAGELASWGHNDSEIPRLHELAARVKNGGLPPLEALEEARAMKASKQDYH